MRNTDYEESIALAAGLRRAVQVRYDEREELSRMIRNELVVAWNEGRKKGSS